MSTVTALKTTVPNLDVDVSATTARALQERLIALIDLQLTLKHIHWNVVGMNFIAVHEMLDPQVDKVREMSDQIAERIATLGASPSGTPKAVTEGRSWGDYRLDRAPVAEHLSALDDVYSGVIADHRRVRSEVSNLDPVSEDMLITQLAELELFQWFVRSHLMDASGEVTNATV